MDVVDAISVSDYLHGLVPEGQTLKLSQLFRDIESDRLNPSFDYLCRRCKKVSELEQFLDDHVYQLMLENGKVARASDRLESGQRHADEYFRKELEASGGSVNNYMELVKDVESLPDDVRHFIDTFYPETELRRFFRRRPYLFTLDSSDGSVRLVDPETVEFFRRALTPASRSTLRTRAVPFMSLRGRVGQAPPYIRAYVNDRYPGTEFLDWLEGHKDVFEVDTDGVVRLKSGTKRPSMSDCGLKKTSDA